MKIGILNAGNIGRTLAKPWHNAGHELMLAKQGNQEKLNKFMSEVAGANRGTLKQVADFCDAVLFSVYWLNLDQVLVEVGDLEGKIVIDTMNPLKVSEQFEHYHDLEFMKFSSTSEELQKRLPKARVVKAFSTMPYLALDSSRWTNSPAKPAIFVASDDPSAKEVVFQLVKDAGFEPFDTGALANARSIEQMGIVLHNVGTHQFGGDYSRLAPTFLQAS